MKQLLSIFLLFFGVAADGSAVCEVPSDTIHRTNGDIIVCDIKVIGSAEIVYEQNDKQERLNKKWIVYITTASGKRTYYNSETHENQAYEKKRTRIFGGRNGSVNIGFAIIGILSFLVVAGGIIGLIRLFNSWG